MPKKKVTDLDTELTEYAHNTINRLMGESGVKEKDLAILIDCSAPEFTKKLSNAEQYKRRDFTLAEYVKLAEKFNISLNTLFGVANPVKTTVPESAKDTCKMLVDISKSEYGFTFMRDKNGRMLMYYPEIYPENVLNAMDPVYVPSEYYTERYQIHEFLKKWDELIGQVFDSQDSDEKISKEQYYKMLDAYLDELPVHHPHKKHKKTDHELIIEEMKKGNPEIQDASDDLPDPDIIEEYKMLYPDAFPDSDPA